MNAILSFFRRRGVRITGLVLLSLVGVIVLSAVSFHFVCKGTPRKVETSTGAQVAQYVSTIPGYKRSEESSTYLTVPEWYEVFSYIEYADALQHGKPSAFPYFGAIGQLWSTYCHMYGQTQATYPFNFGDHLMLVVICTSFSAEYGAKGVWEHTIGWITEHVSTTTPEDAFLAAQAKDYGHFVQVDVWYRYPFASKAVELWTQTPPFGPDMPRKMERKLFLTAEYEIEAVYGFLIKEASLTIFGEPTTEDYAWIDNATPAIFQIEGVKMYRDLGNGSYLITTPHWQGFTDVVPVLARQGVRFADISSMNVIAISVVAPTSWNETTAAPAETLYSMPVLIHPEEKRVILRAPVKQLDEVLLALDGQHVTIEHLFDY